MSYYLFLDDERQVYDVKWMRLPNDEQWLVAKNYGQFVDTVMDLGLPKFVSFDHDLADFHYRVGSMENESSAFGGLNRTFHYGQEKTGYDAAKWLVDYCIFHKLKFPEYAVHSLNAVGGKRISDYIKRYA